MQTEKKKSKEELKEITLSDDSNLILPELSFPSTYQAQSEVKYGARSIVKLRATEHELLEYQKRVSRISSTLTPEEIRSLVSESNERRKALAKSIEEQKEQFHQRHAAELEERFTKEREEARQSRIAHENETQKQIRLDAEEEVKTNRSKELQILENKRRKEKEDVTIFFEQSSNRFSQKYGNATKKIAGETSIDRIISSRPFSTGRFAHRCVVCGYHFPESLYISKIYQHIYENKDQHMQLAISEVNKNYNELIVVTRKRHAEEDNLDLRRQKISKQIESLKKLKGAKLQ